MVKATIKSVAIKMFKSGCAIQLNVHESDNPNNKGYGSLHPTTPPEILEEWLNALGVNLLDIEAVRDLQYLIGNEIMVEFKKTENYGTTISKIASVESTEDDEPESPEPKPEEPTTTQEIPEDDIPF